MANVVVCQVESLEGVVRQLFQAMGAGEDIAVEVARHLVRSNLSGHDSHGVLRIPMYVEQAADGTLIPAARPTVERETPVTALIDAHRGFGHYSTAFALDWAMAHAREHGLAAAAIRRSSHIGRLGEYTERAAKRAPPARGSAAVLLPGKPEARGRDERGRTGIALPESTWEELRAVGRRFGVAIPSVTSWMVIPSLIRGVGGFSRSVSGYRPAFDNTFD